MKKLSTPNDLQDFLDTELGWRIKEISALKTAVRKSADLSQNTMARAAIALLYAHWEGFVKKATSGYLTYVTNQGASYLELQSCFVVFGLKKNLRKRRFIRLF